MSPADAEEHDDADHADAAPERRARALGDGVVRGGRAAGRASAAASPPRGAGRRHRPGVSEQQGA